MARSDSNSDSESSEGSRRRERTPASSPRRHRRTSPPRHPPRFARNLIPRPRFSAMLSEDELAAQQYEMYRRNLPPLVGPDPGMPPPPPPMLFEQKLALQHLEIQRLLSDNQQLAATHLSLRQELAATREQLQCRQGISQTETEKDEQIRTLVERVSKQEVDLRAMDSLKDDLEKLLVQRQELSSRLQQETLRAQADALQIATLKNQIDSLHNEVQRARVACEQERKASAEHLLHRQAMERSYHSVLEEVGRLRIELANNAETRVPTSTTATAVYGSLPVDNGNSTQQKPWGGTYQVQQGMTGQDSLLSMNRQPFHRANNLTPAGLSNGQHVSQDQSVKVTNDSAAGKDWSTHMAPNGQHFYYNVVTGVTQWEKPADIASEDQYNGMVQAQPLQDENSHPPMQFPLSQQAVLEPNQSLWSDQKGSGGTHAQYIQVSPQLGQTLHVQYTQVSPQVGQTPHAQYTQVSQQLGQTPHAGLPGQEVNYSGQVSAQSASRS
eukprot:c17494_g1_i1 orf=152-1639(+)